MGKTNKIINKPRTTFEEREVIMVHNNLFMRTFFGSGLSSAWSITEASKWDGKYELKAMIKEVDGI